jgi:hypothetical protein
MVSARRFHLFAQVMIPNQALAMTARLDILIMEVSALIKIVLEHQEILVLNVHLISRLIH